MTCEGIPRGYEGFAGTAEEIVRMMERRCGQSRRVWVGTPHIFAVTWDKLLKKLNFVGIAVIKGRDCVPLDNRRLPGVERLHQAIRK
jgi:hypothetical protein